MLPTLFIVRDRFAAVHRPGGTRGLPVVLVVSVLLVSGCWTDIEYAPTAGQDDPPAPRASDAEPEAVDGPASDEPQVEAPSADDLAADQFGAELAAVPGDRASSELVDEDERRLPSDSQDATSSPAGAPTETPLPWEDEESAEPTPAADDPATSTPADDAAAETAEAEEESLLPWELPEAADEDTEATTGEDDAVADEPAPAADTGEESLLPWEVDEGWNDDAPAADDPSPPEPARPDDSMEAVEDEEAAVDTTPANVPDSRQLVWLLASKWSYTALAPDGDVAAAIDQLEPIAEGLDLRLPPLDSAARSTGSQQVREVLSAGRTLGAQVGQQYGASYVALVEVAFKSNLLLAIVGPRPHLKHAFTGSVAAAAVRAGIPEAIWQPWQERVAGSDSPAEVGEAVVELHQQVGKFLRESASAEIASPAPTLP